MKLILARFLILSIMFTHSMFAYAEVTMQAGTGATKANQTNGTQKTQIVDAIGVNVPQLHSAFGEVMTAQLSPIWQQSFEYTVSNVNISLNVVSGTGTVIQSQAMAVVSTGTTANSTSRLQSAHHAKYKAGLGGSLRFSALFSSGVAGTWQLIGIMDEHGVSTEFVNGYAIGFNGASATIARFQSDVLFEEPRSTWDDKLDGTGLSGVTLDFTKLNVFYIQYQYLGAGPIFFWTENPDTGIPFKFHTIKYNNRNTSPSTYNPNYHFTMYVNNQATTNNLTVKSASYGYFTEGKTELIEIQQPQYSTGKRSKTTVTTEVAIFTVRNKSTFAGKNNYIEALLERYSSSIEANAANNLGDCRLVKNATLGGVPVYTDISTSNSIVDIDVAGTTVTGGETLVWQPLAGKNDKNIENILNLKIIIHPGETVTAACLSANSATINSSLLWKELQ